MIHIKPVAASPAFVHLNIVMAVIDHLAETAFITYHPHLLVRVAFGLEPVFVFIRLQFIKVNPGQRYHRRKIGMSGWVAGGERHRDPQAGTRKVYA